MKATETTGSPYRTAVRWGLLLAGLVTAAMRVPELHRFWVQWHALSGVDASAAEAYKTYFEVEAAITLFVLAVAAVLFYALRPRQQKPQ
ncbi:MAG TPA: hypothetical protein VJW93_12040 [Candidatus Acidoferrales bacterium]|nr:hypothetical protein [Candidatus Acidoferrales bacterium]